MKKRVLALLLTLVMVFSLVGCKDKKETKTDADTPTEGASTPEATATAEAEAGSEDTPGVGGTLTLAYNADIDNLDYTFTQRATNNEHVANFVDSLLENDSSGNLVPDLAESWEVSADGLTYTYHIRQGVKWVTSEGTEYAEVTAQDWVTALKHAADVESETLYIVSGSVKGLQDYIDGKTKDFSTVGVKAVDDYTLEYTLNQSEPYWNSKTTYGILFPINAEFLESQGESFGSTDPSSILYNGPFLLTNNTAKSVIEYTKNENYWDAGNVFIDGVKYIYNDGSDPDSYFAQFQEGTLSQAAVYPNSAGFSKVTEAYPDGVIFSQSNGTTYNMTFNFARVAYEHTSKKSDKEKSSTAKAILNRDFRLALLFAFNRTSYSAQGVGDEAAAARLRNTLIPPQFLQVNGENYGKTVAGKLSALDSDAFGGIDLSDGQDPYYNAKKAKEYISKARTTLEAEGVKFPIHLDLPELETSEILVNQAKSLKQSIESALGTDNVVIDIQLLAQDPFYAATYYATTGAASDFDISTASGWSPDYDDPATYLNIYNSRTGDMLSTLGLTGTNLVEGKDTSADAKAALKITDYDAQLDTAAAITGKDQLNERYTAYAEAEAWLLDNVLQIPIYNGGGRPRVTKVIPFTVPYGWSGISADKLKYIKLQAEPVTQNQYDAALSKWNTARSAAGK